MARTPLRVAAAALSKRIFAGYLTKDGRQFREPRHDVTSDVLRAVVDYIGPDREATITEDGRPLYTITVRTVAPTLSENGLVRFQHEEAERG